MQRRAVAVLAGEVHLKLGALPQHAACGWRRSARSLRSILNIAAGCERGHEASHSDLPEADPLRRSRFVTDSNDGKDGRRATLHADLNLHLVAKGDLANLGRVARISRGACADGKLNTERG